MAELGSETSTGLASGTIVRRLSFGIVVTYFNFQKWHGFHAKDLGQGNHTFQTGSSMNTVHAINGKLAEQASVGNPVVTSPSEATVCRVTRHHRFHHHGYV